jgi:hypothetical protein
MLSKIYNSAKIPLRDQRKRIPRGGVALKKILVPVLFASLIFLMGMGDLGGSAPAGKVPAPEKNFKVRIVDREGVQTSLSLFSQEGKVFLAGKRGDAVVTIPFENVTQVQFEPLEGSDVRARVSIKGAEGVEIRLEKRAKLYGKADFGTFQIEAKDVKSVTFLP